jgi:hypothetical protein
VLDAVADGLLPPGAGQRPERGKVRDAREALAADCCSCRVLLARQTPVKIDDIRRVDGVTRMSAQGAGSAMYPVRASGDTGAQATAAG